MSRQFFIGVIVTGMLVGPVVAGQLDIMTFSDTVAAYYLRGDYAGASRFLRPLADQGDARAQYGLGNLYANGRGGLQDYAEAARWYRMAAEQGNPGSQDALGSLYEMGLGVPQDYVLAYMWWNLAGAQAGLPRIVSQGVRESRDRVAAKMTPDQIAEAQRLAREWKPAAGETSKGGVEAMVTQGEIDALKDQIEACWVIPLGWTDPREVSVTIRFRLNINGTVNGTPTVIESPASEFAQVSANNAIRAVMQCAPYALPREKYDHGP